MHKIWMGFIGICTAASALALPIGNPWEASLQTEGLICSGNSPECCTSWCDAWSLRLGYYGDYVFNQHMRVDADNNSSSIPKTELYTNAGYLAFNLCDRLDLFATLGASSLHIFGSSSSFASTARDREFIESETAFSWSVGVRGTIWQCGCWGLGAEAQYFQTSPDLNYMRNQNNPAGYAHGVHLDYHEWQAGLGLAYRVEIVCCNTALIPYLGIKANHAWIDTGTPQFDEGERRATLFDLENERYFGFAVGMTLLGCNRGSITVEGRFMNEKAVYFNGQFRF